MGLDLKNDLVFSILFVYTSFFLFMIHILFPTLQPQNYTFSKYNWILCKFVKFHYQDISKWKKPIHCTVTVLILQINMHGNFLLVSCYCYQYSIIVLGTVYNLIHICYHFTGKKHFHDYQLSSVLWLHAFTPVRTVLRILCILVSIMWLTW